MEWIFLIAVVAVIVCVVRKNNAEMSSNNTPHNNSSPAHSKAASPVKEFDENSPYEIYKITHALSYIAAIAGDSHVTVVLQDEDSTKGWPKCMCIQALIDDCIASREERIPSDVKQYLKSIPFNASRTSSFYSVEYTFKEDICPTPSAFKYGVIDEMKKGASKSTFVINGMYQFRVRDNGYIALDVDD